MTIKIDLGFDKKANVTIFCYHINFFHISSVVSSQFYFMNCVEPRKTPIYATPSVFHSRFSGSGGGVVTTGRQFLRYGTHSALLFFQLTFREEARKKVLRNSECSDIFVAPADDANIISISRNLQRRTPWKAH